MVKHGKWLCLHLFVHRKQRRIPICNIYPCNALWWLIKTVQMVNVHSHTYTIYGNKNKWIKKNLFFFSYGNVDVSDQSIENPLVCMFHTQWHAELDLYCSGPGLEAFLTSQSLGLGLGRCYTLVMTWSWLCWSWLQHCRSYFSKSLSKRKGLIGKGVDVWVSFPTHQIQKLLDLRSGRLPSLTS